MTDLGSIRAPAKINLCLHVTGRRGDGYHLLDSIVAQLSVHDTLEIRVDPNLPDDELRLDGEPIEGAPGDNLVAKAIRAFRANHTDGWHLPSICASLTKNLPVASGMGGGSSDAVAALRLLAAHAESVGHGVDASALASTALQLGADCPLFLHDGPVRMRGIGEHIEPVDGWGDLCVVLVNPKVHVSTPDIFKRLKTTDNEPFGALSRKNASPAERMHWLATSTRNDLQTAAARAAPVIADVLAALGDTDNCKLTRMSGSGATCFGLYANRGHAHAAATHLKSSYPDWWVETATTLSPKDRTK